MSTALCFLSAAEGIDHIPYTIMYLRAARTKPGEAHVGCMKISSRQLAAGRLKPNQNPFGTVSH
eukprot:11637064-Karenia_brevis.AAC.1